MTYTLIERMARAMCAEDGVDPDAMMLPGVPWLLRRAGGYIVSGEPFPVWRSYVRLAIAALTAIRVPTEAMVEAGRSEIQGSLRDMCSRDEGVDITKEAWTAMVDVALKEPSH